MAHEGIYATSAECIAKLGSNYNSTNVDEAMINGFSLQAEGLINGVARKIFAADSTAFTALSGSVKGILSEAASNLVGIYGLNYNPRGENDSMSRIEYEDRINVLRDGLLRALSLLRDQKLVTYLLGA